MKVLFPYPFFKCLNKTLEDLELGRVLHNEYRRRICNVKESTWSSTQLGESVKKS